MSAIGRMMCGTVMLAAAAAFSTALAAAEIAGKDVELPAKERKVHAEYYPAAGTGPRPSVLMLHGASGIQPNRVDSYRHYAHAFADAGMDAYLVYYYAPGEKSPKAADLTDMRYATWGRLVDDLAEHLVHVPNATGKVGIAGFSNGGMLTTSALSQDNNVSAAVILYGTDFTPVTEKAKHYPPLLILHGAKDTTIPIEGDRKFADRARALGGPVEMVEYPDAPHGFGLDIDTPDGADALKRSVAYLKTQLVSGGQGSK